MIAYFIKQNGEKVAVKAEDGDTILELAHNNNIDLEGACGGNLACSTCHVIVDPEWAEKLDDASVAEEDMLEMVWNYEKTSRLGCQIKMSEKIDGIVVKVPK